LRFDHRNNIPAIKEGNAPIPGRLEGNKGKKRWNRNIRISPRINAFL